VRADRLGQRALQTGLGSPLEQYLAHPVRTQPGALDRAAAVDFAEQRAGGDLGEFEPLHQRGDRASFLSLSARNGNFGTFALLVRLGPLDQQFQPLVGPGDVRHIQPDKLGAAQCSGKAEQEQRSVPGACDAGAAGPAQLADLGRGQRRRSSRRVPCEPEQAK
jgi:hypothetical protein